MKILIIFAHPEPVSFTGRMKDYAIRVLQDAGHEIDVSDLYNLEFQTAGNRNEFKKIQNKQFFDYQAEQAHAALSVGFSPEIIREQEKVKRAEVILFIFPLWWDAPPAILKAWIERVLAMGFAYGNQWKFSDGPLKGKKAMSIISTAGSQEIYRPNAFRGDLEKLLYWFHHGTLFALGFEVLPPFVAWDAREADDIVQGKYLEELALRLRVLPAIEPISYHPLRDFGEDYQLKTTNEDKKPLEPPLVACHGCGSLIPWDSDYCTECIELEKKEES